MAEKRTPSLFLVTYDFKSEHHGRVRALFLKEFGEEGDRWVRLQNSVIVVYTDIGTAGIKQLFDIHVGKGAGRVFIVDIIFGSQLGPDTSYKGYGKKDAWDWMAAKRLSQNEELRRQNEEFFHQNPLPDN